MCDVGHVMCDVWSKRSSKTLLKSFSKTLFYQKQRFSTKQLFAIAC